MLKPPIRTLHGDPHEGRQKVTERLIIPRFQRLIRLLIRNQAQNFLGEKHLLRVSILPFETLPIAFPVINGLILHLLRGGQNSRVPSALAFSISHPIIFNIIRKHLFGLPHCL